MTDRDKIANVLNSTEISQELSKEDIYKFADALIEAGIGDTTNLTVENEVLQRDVDNLTRTLEEGTEEFQEVQHRAEVAERALRNVTERASCNICDNFSCRYYEGINYDYNAEECIKWWLVQAEKELAEEE